MLCIVVAVNKGAVNLTQRAFSLPVRCTEPAPLRTARRRPAHSLFLLCVCGEAIVNAARARNGMSTRQALAIAAEWW